MATDEREWTLTNLERVPGRMRWEVLADTAPDGDFEERATVVSKARAEAAEQERDNLRTAWRGAEGELGDEREKRMAAEQRIRELDDSSRIARQAWKKERLVAQAKLATAVETLRFYGSEESWRNYSRVNPSQAGVDKGRKARGALTEIGESDQ